MQTLLRELGGPNWSALYTDSRFRQALGFLQAELSCSACFFAIRRFNRKALAMGTVLPSLANYLTAEWARLQEPIRRMRLD
jgi:hypothetical protein